MLNSRFSSVSDPGAVPVDADARYPWEKHMIRGKNLLPLVVVPDFAALDSRVRNWSRSAWGEWHLADVWLDHAVAGTNPHDVGAAWSSNTWPAGARP